MTLSEAKKQVQDRFNSLRLLNEDIISRLYQYAAAGNLWESSFGSSTIRMVVDELVTIKTAILTTANYQLVAEARSVPVLKELIAEMEKEMDRHHEIIKQLEAMKDEPPDD